MENNSNFTMKQKTLAIMKWTTRKYLPLSIAYWILLFMALPMIELFSMIVCASNSAFKDYVEAMKEGAQYLPGTFFAAIAIAFSLIITIITFSYMHNKRCVDLFGGLPISRRSLFFARYVSALIMSIVPVIIIGFSGAMLTLSNDGIIETLKIMGYIILGVIGNVSFLAFVSVCCGTVADVLISYILINAIYPIGVVICYYFPNSVIPGLASGYMSDSIFTLFSPIAAPFVGIYGDGKVLHIVWWLAFSIVLVAGCYVLCKKRKAETAQNAFAFATVEVVIKFITCFVAGFGTGWIFANIGAAYGTIKAQYVWFFIGMFIGIMIVNFLVHLVFNRGINKFVKSLGECGIVAVVITGFLFSVTTGAFGYDERIPDIDDVQEVYVVTDEYDKFVVNGKNYLEKYIDDNDTINETIKIHQNVIDEYKKTKNVVYPIVDGQIDYTDAEEVVESEDVKSEYEEIFYLELNYKCKNGDTMSRKYELYNINVTVPKNLSKKFRIDEKEILNIIPEKYIDNVTVSTGGLDFVSFVKNYDHENKISEMHKFIEILKGDIKQYGITDKKGSDEIAVDIYYEDSTYTYSKAAYIIIPESYVNTLKYMKEHKLIGTESDWFKKEANYNYSVQEAKEYLANRKPIKTIYFKMPEDWDKTKEIRAMQFDSDYMNFYTDISSEFSKCEKVSEDIWKYDVYNFEDIEEEYNKIVFFQFNGDNVNISGAYDFNKNDNDYLLLKEKKKNRTVTDYHLTIYKYEWADYTSNK